LALAQVTSLHIRDDLDRVPARRRLKWQSIALACPSSRSRSFSNHHFRVSVRHNFRISTPYSSVAGRRTSILSALAVVTVCVASVVNWHTAPGAVDTWLGRLFGLMFALLIFSPFFIATHVLGEARRTLGVYKHLDSIVAWVSLFYFGFGGVFFLHRSVANAAELVFTEGRMDKGISDATVV
jgi:hypothetical protein